MQENVDDDDDDEKKTVPELTPDSQVNYHEGKSVYIS